MPPPVQQSNWWLNQQLEKALHCVFSWSVSSWCRWSILIILFPVPHHVSHPYYVSTGTSHLFSQLWRKRWAIPWLWLWFRCVDMLGLELVNYGTPHSTRSWLITIMPRGPTGVAVHQRPSSSLGESQNGSSIRWSISCIRGDYSCGYEIKTTQVDENPSHLPRQLGQTISRQPICVCVFSGVLQFPPTLA